MQPVIEMVIVAIALKLIAHMNTLIECIVESLSLITVKTSEDIVIIAETIKMVSIFLFILFLFISAP